MGVVCGFCRKGIVEVICRDWPVRGGLGGPEDEVGRVFDGGEGLALGGVVWGVYGGGLVVYEKNLPSSGGQVTPIKLTGWTVCPRPGGGAIGALGAIMSL